MSLGTENPLYQTRDVPVSKAIAWLICGEWISLPELARRYAERDIFWNNPFQFDENGGFEFAEITNERMLRYINSKLAKQSWAEVEHQSWDAGGHKGVSFVKIPKVKMEKSLNSQLKKLSLSIEDMKGLLEQSIQSYKSYEEKVDTAEEALRFAARDKKLDVYGETKEGKVKLIPYEDFKDNDVRIYPRWDGDKKNREGDRLVQEGEIRKFCLIDWRNLQVSRDAVGDLFFNRPDAKVWGFY